MITDFDSSHVRVNLVHLYSIIQDTAESGIQDFLVNPRFASQGICLNCQFLVVHEKQPDTKVWQECGTGELYRKYRR